MSTLKFIVFGIPPQPQSQDSLREQLVQLRIAANRLGLYDAADWLREQTPKAGA